MMKPIVLFLILFLATWCGPDANGQAAMPRIEAQSVPEPEMGLESSYFYGTQAEVWEREVRRNPNNPDAWFNYFQAVRGSGTNPETGEIDAQTRANLNNVLRSMRREVGESFEYHYGSYLNAPGLREGGSSLEKAFLKDPSRTEAFDDLALYRELTRDINGRNSVLQLMSRKRVVPREVMDYNYNVLMSMEEEGILFTNGTFDTHPVWILQSEQKVRPQVEVLNLDLLSDPTYRAKQFRAIGLKEATEGDPKTSPSVYFKSLAAANPEKNIYFGLTLPPDVRKAMKSQLYLTGLVFRYSESTFDNLSEIEGNWQRFRAIPSKRVRNTAAEGLRGNYAMPLVLLARRSFEQGDLEQAKAYKEQALRTTSDHSARQRMTTYFNQLGL